ncbi:glycoside hydrolase family 16 protein [Moniliophthora roreri]|nr:glycoside hydrolase family 16 protein [Moniliophthora roreri]
MSTSRPSPLPIHDSRPQPKFIENLADGEIEQVAVANPSRQPISSAPESPPVTPRSITFSTTANPFSPPASVRSFSTDPPNMTPNSIHNGNQYNEPTSPRSGVTSLPGSVADLSHMSSFYGGSRPTTADTHRIYGASRPTTADTQRFYGSSRPTTADTQSRPGSRREAFTSPPPRPLTIYSTPGTAKPKRDRPKSTMLTDGPVLEKSWLEKRDPYARISYFVTYAVVFFGVVASGIKCFFDYKHVPMIEGNLCPVLDENFDSPDSVFGDNGKFFREVDMSGFGNGEFQMTTSSENNSFVANGHLYIYPTLTSASIPMDSILDGHVFNITDCSFNITRGASYTQSSPNSPLSFNTSAIGSDTFDAEGYYKACSAYSNSTQGKIINPVQSARLSTRRSASIKYGKVEVRAKIPTGDWLWPAIWMLPVDNTYGSWPLSGEIDIMEARGNSPSYPKQGTNYVRGSLNWGPTTWLNAVSKTYGWWKRKRGSWDTDFHTYSLEWTENFMRIYVDSRLYHLLDLRLNKPFWDRGDFPTIIQNGSEVISLGNPWINGTKAAPFDQRFYLILSLGIGGTNGWFPDGSEKPWLDGSQTAMRDFLLAQDKWYPSWSENPEDRAFVIDSVKMWQLC